MLSEGVQHCSRHDVLCAWFPVRIGTSPLRPPHCCSVAQRREHPAGGGGGRGALDPREPLCPAQRCQLDDPASAGWRLDVSQTASAVHIPTPFPSHSLTPVTLTRLPSWDCCRRCRRRCRDSEADEFQDARSRRQSILSSPGSSACAQRLLLLLQSLAEPPPCCTAHRPARLFPCHSCIACPSSPPRPQTSRPATTTANFSRPSTATMPRQVGWKEGAGGQGQPSCLRLLWTAPSGTTPSLALIPTPCASVVAAAVSASGPSFHSDRPLLASAGASPEGKLGGGAATTPQQQQHTLLADQRGQQQQQPAAFKYSHEYPPSPLPDQQHGGGRATAAAGGGARRGPLMVVLPAASASGEQHSVGSSGGPEVSIDGRGGITAQVCPPAGGGVPRRDVNNAMRTTLHCTGVPSSPLPTLLPPFALAPHTACRPMQLCTAHQAVRGTPSRRWPAASPRPRCRYPS